MKSTLINIALITGILILVNVLGAFFYKSLDLTEEKRYTLTDSTKKILHDLEDVVYVKVLLGGKFPAGFKRLQTSVKETLEDFRSYSSYIEYDFINPSEGTTEEINERRQNLADLGIVPVNLRLAENDGATKKLIYPFAIFYFKGKQIAVNFLENKANVPPEIALNNSINQLEYKFASAIQKVQFNNKPVIAFTSGHGELNKKETQTIFSSLRAFYEVGQLVIDSAYHITQDIDLVVIAKPRRPFSDRDKFILDQYVMNGGKILWMIDKLNVNLDSIANNHNYVPMDYETNLDDILFKYGIRIQPDLVLDMRCSTIPQVVGMQGNRPQIEQFKWYYHPIVVPDSDNPIVRNIDGINMYFPSSIDTIKTKTPVKKTILLTSSEYSMLQFSPVRLNFDILRYPAKPEKFNKPHQTLGVLLEGTFPSLYENRVSKEMLGGLKKLGEEFKKQSVPTKMMVISDGDMAKTQINPQTGATYAPGYNRYMKFTFDNQDFVINAVEYLMGGKGVLEARGREVTLRLMNQVKMKKEKQKWQLVNNLIPLGFLVLFGFGFNFIRRRRYS